MCKMTPTKRLDNSTSKVLKKRYPTKERRAKAKEIWAAYAALVKEKVLEGWTVVLPLRVGNLYGKELPKKKGLRVDFGETEKLRARRPDLDNPIVYHTGEMRGGFWPIIAWTRSIANFRTRSSYACRPLREFERALCAAAKAGTTYEYPIENYAENKR